MVAGYVIALNALHKKRTGTPAFFNSGTPRSQPRRVTTRAGTGRYTNRKRVRPLCHIPRRRPGLYAGNAVLEKRNWPPRRQPDERRNQPASRLHQPETLPRPRKRRLYSWPRPLQRQLRPHQIPGKSAAGVGAALVCAVLSAKKAPHKRRFITDGQLKLRAPPVVRPDAPLPCFLLVKHVTQAASVGAFLKLSGLLDSPIQGNNKQRASGPQKTTLPTLPPALRPVVCTGLPLRRIYPAGISSGAGRGVPGCAAVRARFRVRTSRPLPIYAARRLQT